MSLVACKPPAKFQQTSGRSRAGRPQPAAPALISSNSLQRRFSLHSLGAGSRRLGPQHAAALPEAAVNVALGVSLAFLPWSGCDQGGFYSTGIKGEPGKDCQVIYQPAAAAEERLKQRLRKQPEPAPAPPVETKREVPTPASTPAPAPDAASTPAAPPAEAAPAREPEAAAASTPSAGFKGGAEVLSPEAKGFLRDELTSELRARNKELVDAAWQSLE